MNDNPFRESEWPESRPTDGGPLFLYLAFIFAVIFGVAALASHL